MTAALPPSARSALENGRPTFLLEAAIKDADGNPATLWFDQERLGRTTDALDYPASTTLLPVLATDFEVDQVLDLDEMAALIPRLFRTVNLVDAAVGEGDDGPPTYPVRQLVHSHIWTGGRVTLYALPAGAQSLRERVAIATGRPAIEPSTNPVETGDRFIALSLDSPLKIVGERDAEVETYVGVPSGWRNLSGDQSVSVAHIAAYDITSFTLLSRFQSAGFGAGGVSALWRRLSGSSNWTTINNFSTGRLRWSIGDGVTTAFIAETPSGQILDDGVVHTLIAAIDGDRRFYLAVDGVKVAEGAPPFAPATPAVATMIARGMTGYVTDQRMVNGYLEFEQAVALQRTAPAAEDLDLSVIGYWRFDDGAGTAVTDYAPAGNDGTASGVEDTDFEWVPTDLGMLELAGRAMPWVHGTITNAPAEPIDPQRDRYRINDRAIALPAAPSIQLRARGFGVSSADGGGGVRTTTSTLDEPATFSQSSDVLYQDLLAEILPLRCGLALGTGISEESLSTLGQLLPDVAGYAGRSGGDVPKVSALLEALLGGAGAHLRETPYGVAAAGYWLPPVSPGPDGESAVLEHLGLPDPIRVPPPGATLYASYTVAVAVRCFSTFGTPADKDEFLATELLAGSAFAAHYRPGSDDILFLLGSDGRGRSGIVFGDSVSSVPVFATTKGGLPIGEWIWIFGRADATGGTRKIYTAAPGGTVTELASAAYAGVAAGDRPGDGYTALGGRPGGQASLAGSVAHYALWGAALSTADMNAVVAAGSPGAVPTNLVSHVPGTEGSGDFVEDVVAGTTALIHSQRWAPRLTLSAFGMPGTVELRREWPLRPARKIQVAYRPNFRPMAAGDLAGDASGPLTVAERAALRAEWKEDLWSAGPDDGIDIRLETPFFRALTAQRLIELIRLRRSADPRRYVREVLLRDAGKSLVQGEEIRLNDLRLPDSSAGSWTGRCTSMMRAAYSLRMGLIG